MKQENIQQVQLEQFKFLSKPPVCGSQSNRAFELITAYCTDIGKGKLNSIIQLSNGRSMVTQESSTILDHDHFKGKVTFSFFIPIVRHDKDVRGHFFRPASPCTFSKACEEKHRQNASSNLQSFVVETWQLQLSNEQFIRFVLSCRVLEVRYVNSV